MSRLKRRMETDPAFRRTVQAARERQAPYVDAFADRMEQLAADGWTGVVDITPPDGQGRPMTWTEHSVGSTPDLSQEQP